jgi:hypothetical protein
VIPVYNGSDFPPLFIIFPRVQPKKMARHLFLTTKRGDPCDDTVFPTGCEAGGHDKWILNGYVVILVCEMMDNSGMKFVNRALDYSKAQSAMKVFTG